LFFAKFMGATEDSKPHRHFCSSTAYWQYSSKRGAAPDAAHERQSAHEKAFAKAVSCQ
jgi:hypothetical protein